MKKMRQVLLAIACSMSLFACAGGGGVNGISGPLVPVAAATALSTIFHQTEP